MTGTSTLVIQRNRRQFVFAEQYGEGHKNQNDAIDAAVAAWMGSAELNVGGRDVVAGVSTGDRYDYHTRWVVDEDNRVWMLKWARGAGAVRVGCCITEGYLYERPSESVMAALFAAEKADEEGMRAAQLAYWS